MVTMTEELKSVIESTRPAKLSVFNKVRLFFWKRKLRQFVRDIYTQGCTLEISGNLGEKIVYSLVHPDSMSKDTANKLADDLSNLLISGINIFGGDSSKYQFKTVINDNENT